MADYHERIKSARGFAVDLRGDIEAVERAARHCTQHRDFYTAITEAKLTTTALIDALTVQDEFPGQLKLEVVS